MSDKDMGSLNGLMGLTLKVIGLMERQKGEEYSRQMKGKSWKESGRRTFQLDWQSSNTKMATQCIRVT
jgi:hypothetical protein